MSMYPPVQRTMVRLLSPPRTSTYLAAGEDDVSRAVDLYRWNLDVSMAFFESLHDVEVVGAARRDVPPPCATTSRTSTRGAHRPE